MCQIHAPVKKLPGMTPMLPWTAGRRQEEKGSFLLFSLFQLRENDRSVMLWRILYPSWEHIFQRLSLAGCCEKFRHLDKKISANLNRIVVLGFSKANPLPLVKFYMKFLSWGLSLSCHEKLLYT